MKFLIVSLIVILASTCNKKEVDADKIVFGSSHGFCMGDCAQLYKIENQQLYADTISRMTDDPGFSNTALPAKNYDMAKSLVKNIPAYLYDHANQTFGCPDCADQGVYHLQVMKDNKLMTWKFDGNISANPPEVRAFVTSMRDVLQKLK